MFVTNVTSVLGWKNKTIMTSWRSTKYWKETNGSDAINIVIRFKLTQPRSSCGSRNDWQFSSQLREQLISALASQNYQLFQIFCAAPRRNYNVFNFDHKLNYIFCHYFEGRAARRADSFQGCLYQMRWAPNVIAIWKSRRMENWKEKYSTITRWMGLGIFNYLNQSYQWGRLELSPPRIEL